jgi:hypothetical protein
MVELIVPQGVIVGIFQRLFGTDIITIALVDTIAVVVIKVN